MRTSPLFGVASWHLPGPKEVNGYFQVRAPTGDAPNPLWQFDGNVGLLTSTAKE